MNEEETTPPAQPPQTPQPQVPQKMQALQPSQASQTLSVQPPKKPKRRWPWVLVAVLILFLGTIGGFVPVENIPILRNIVHAMGFTPDEAKQMSFLRALLTWTDKTLGLNGRLSAGPNLQGKSQLFSANSESGDSDVSKDDPQAALQGKMDRYNGQSGLFDIRTLNELQQQKGLPAEQITGTVLLQPGQKAETRAMIADTEGTANTDANKTQNEVYFGSDISSLSHTLNSGYESVNLLKKVINPHIADGRQIDWLQQMTSHLMKTDMGLAGIDKDLGNSVIGWNIHVEEQGDGKGQRDLYYAWITSRMSKYTTNLMLKKRLASIGFLGGEIPTHVSDSFAMGGIRIDTDALSADQEGWKKYQEFEKNCKEELLDEGRGGDKVKKAVDSFNSKFSTWTQPIEGYSQRPLDNFGFPKNCAEFKTLSKGSYTANLSDIVQNCKDARDGYESLYNSCAMAVDWDKECDGGFVNTYVKRWESFETYCKEFCENEAKKYAPGTYDIENCKQNIQPGLNEWEGNKAGNTEVELLDVVGGKTDYFPQIVKGEKNEQNLVEDEQGAENVKETIKAGVYKF